MSDCSSNGNNLDPVAVTADMAQDLANAFHTIKELAERSTSNPEGVLAKIAQICEFVQGGNVLRPTMGVGEVLARVEGEDDASEPYDVHGVSEDDGDEVLMPAAKPVVITVTGSQVVVSVGG